MPKLCLKPQLQAHWAPWFGASWPLVSTCFSDWGSWSCFVMGEFSAICWFWFLTAQSCFSTSGSWVASLLRCSRSLLFPRADRALPFPLPPPIEGDWDAGPVLLWRERRVALPEPGQLTGR